MPPFDVPGWSVAAAPVREASSQVSKKRKRPSNGPQKTEGASLNLDKLANTLKHTHKRKDNSISNRKSSPQKKHNSEKPKPAVLLRQAGNPRSEHAGTPQTPAPPSKQLAKKRKTKNLISDTAPTTSGSGGMKDESGLTSLQKGMKQSLDGARFRLINESLYKSSSNEAHKLMREDPRVYEEYHIGFRHQVQLWPTNPIQHYIESLSAYPARTVIADLGCGDAALARTLIPQGKTVLSFDLVSDGAFVIEADICNSIPLPGSEGDTKEKSVGEGHVVDVVICSLSLMGTNWTNCLREAWRILKSDGELKIAEVASRFIDVEEFQQLVGSIGFRMKAKDDSNTHFVLFEFRKVARSAKTAEDWAQIAAKGSILKPCEYKRR